MRIRRLRDRIALLLAIALGVTGLTATGPASAVAEDGPAEVHGLKGEYWTHSAPAPSTSTNSRPSPSTLSSTSTTWNRA